MKSNGDRNAYGIHPFANFNRITDQTSASRQLIERDIGSKVFDLN